MPSDKTPLAKLAEAEEAIPEPRIPDLYVWLNKVVEHRHEVYRPGERYRVDNDTLVALGDAVDHTEEAPALLEETPL